MTNAKILHLETATNVCSVAVSKGDTVLSIRETHEDRSHGTVLASFMEEVMEEAGLENQELDAVAVSIGPGSYTGLRIGVSMTKGFAYALQIPIIAVPTLQTMVIAALDDAAFENICNTSPNCLLCPMIDARRMEVFTALYNSKAEEIEKTTAKILSEDSYKDILQKTPVVFFGNGAAKAINIIDHENAHFIDSITPSAQYMVPLALKKFRKEEFEDSAYFEPFYLKDFIATTPKKKVL